MKRSLSLSLLLVVATVSMAARKEPPSGPGDGPVRATLMNEVRIATPDPGRQSRSDLTLQTKLLAGDGASMDAFGSAVELDGDTVIAGAFLHDGAAMDSGAAYVFRLGEGGWVEEGELAADDAAAADFFGAAVAIDDGTALVGAYQNDAVAMDSGAVYAFRRDAAVWSQQQKLTPSDGAATDLFGFSVALEGDAAVAGAILGDGAATDSGAAYVFRDDGSAWSEEAELAASDGAGFDWFGTAVAIDGDTAIVGASQHDHNGMESGAAYVFVDDGATWSEQAELLADDGEPGDLFGSAVALSGDVAVVGAYQDDDGGLDAGAAYVFRREGTAWLQEAKLLAGDAAAGAGFGFSVSVAGDRVVVGAIGDSQNGAGSGAVYLFVRQDDAWVQDQKLAASDAEPFDRLGFSVATGDGRVVAGADLEDTLGMDAGAAYVFEEAVTNQPPVADAGDDVTLECTSVQGAEVTLDGSASFDPDGTDAIVRFEWFENFGLPTQASLGDGEVLAVTLPLGVHDVTLRVTDDRGASDTSDVQADVVDETPPEISVAVSPSVLWPPNHDLVPVTAMVTATDRCSVPEVILDSIASNEPDDSPGGGDGNTTGDIREAEVGTADFDVLLRAERSGSGGGRIYTLRYTATDAAGNGASAGAEVRVPHDRRVTPGTDGAPQRKTERQRP